MELDGFAIRLYRNRYRRCKKKLTFEFEDHHLHNIQIFANNKSLKNIIQKMSLIQLRAACAIYTVGGHLVGPS